MSELEKAHDRLVEWTASLFREVESSRLRIRDTLDPSTTLPDNCPSRAAAAVMELGGVKERLTEVQGAIKDVEAAIWKTQG